MQTTNETACSGKCEGTLCADSFEVFVKTDALNRALHVGASVYIREGKQRAGQAYFNALRDEAPDLAEIIRGTEDDPFNDDSRIDRFFAAVMGDAEFSWEDHLRHASRTE